MTCYRRGGCGPYEMRSCYDCPASKPEYANKYNEANLNKSGEWIEYQVPNIICCSECDWGTSVDEKHLKYCPNCGVKMENPNENN